MAHFGKEKDSRFSKAHLKRRNHEPGEGELRELLIFAAAGVVLLIMLCVAVRHFTQFPPL